MPITVPCLRCKTKFSVPSKLAGTTVRCKNCGCAMRLPSPEKIQAKKQAAGAKGAGARAGKSGAAPKPSPAGAAKQSSAGLLEEPFEFLELDAPKSGQGGASTAPLADPTVLSCSHCEGLLYYDPNFANQTVACPHCGNHLIMPEL